MTEIVCFGEVLWDVFPDAMKIGGAPLNVALRLKSFGNETKLISAVGKDENGKILINTLNTNGLSTEHIQIKERYKTGTVTVKLDNNGNANYTINQPVAWDFISLDQYTISLVKNSKALVFGSLACRNKHSYITLLQLIEVSTFNVMDVNLRPPFYSENIFQNLLPKVDLLKLNEEELVILMRLFNLKSENITKDVKRIAQHFNITTICLTLGAEGALLYHKNKMYTHKAYKVVLKDTVGAGDSFLATLLHELFKQTEVNIALQRACAVGALVASKFGANAVVANKEIEQLIK